MFQSRFVIPPLTCAVLRRNVHIGFRKMANIADHYDGKKAYKTTS